MVNEIVWAPEISFDMKQRMLQTGIARRTQLEQVEQMFDSDAQRAEIKVSLRKAAEVMGKELDDATLEYGVTQVLNEAYRFQEPQKNLSYKLAEKFIERDRIIKKRVIPGAIIGGVLGAIVVGANLISTAHEHSKENAVEQKVEAGFTQRKSLLTELNSLEAKLSEGFSGQKVQFSAKIDTAKTELEKTNSFFQTYIQN